MKLIRNFLVAYTLIISGAFAVLLYHIKNARILIDNAGSYTDEELQVYKIFWKQMNAGVEETRNDLYLYCIILWAVLLVVGYLFTFAVYITQIKPIKEMENVATEIAKGNLEVPLPVRRGNDYRGFAESFDMMRESIKASKERELAAERAKNEMVAELSHDLKTPVATIQATCEVLELQLSKKKETNASPEVEGTLEKVGYIAQKADTINQLVQNVLHATLEDMDEIKVNVEEYNSIMIEDYFRGLKDYGNIIMENSIQECLVYMDKLRMEQVVDNIVGNSYKYAGTDIYVSFDETEVPAPDDKTNRYIRVTVRDKGPGVHESELPMIIEKYYRGKDAGDKNGYGLGLYLVKTYMEKQSGGMEYYNDDGFVVELLIRKV